MLASFAISGGILTNNSDNNPFLLFGKTYKVHFKGMSSRYCRWILWGAEAHQFVAQGTYTGNRHGASVNVSGGGRGE